MIPMAEGLVALVAWLVASLISGVCAGLAYRQGNRGLVAVLALVPVLAAFVLTGGVHG